MLGRRRELESAMNAYDGRYDKIMLKHIYYALKQKFEGPLIIDVARGVKLTGEWIVRVKADKEDEVDKSELLHAFEIIKVADYALAFVATVPVDVFQFFGMYHAGDVATRYIRNISTFCFGAHVAKVYTDNDSSTAIIDGLVRVLKTKRQFISRASASQTGDRAFRYFGFIVKSGLDNLFSIHYTRERVCKSNANQYAAIIAEVQMMGRVMFDEFYSVLPEGNIFRGFINEALIEFDSRFGLNTAATDESSLNLFNGYMPKKKKRQKVRRRNKWIFLYFNVQFSSAVKIHWLEPVRGKPWMIISQSYDAAWQRPIL